MTRIARLAERLSRPLLVTRPANIRYLTGMGDSSNAALLVEPDGEATFYTDFRYADAARALQDVTFVQTQRYVIGALASLLAGREIGADPEHLPFARWEELRAGGVTPVPAGGDVEALRAVKDASEVDAIRRAAAISDTVFAELATERFVGRTERELVWQLDRRFRELGAERSSFDTMVGAGEMGARPHGEARDEKIPAGTMVVVDGGCVVDGYCSDCTRTFLTGDEPRLRELYDICLQAQLDGLAAVRAGVTGRDADAASRVAIAAAGLGRAGDLSRRRRRCANRGSRPRHRGRLRAPDHGDEGADRRRLTRGNMAGEQVPCCPTWQTSSTPTASATACTSSTRTRCGASSSSSM